MEKKKKYILLLLLLIFLIAIGFLLLKTGFVAGILGLGKWQDPNSNYQHRETNYKPPLDFFDEMMVSLGIETEDIDFLCLIEVDMNYSVCTDACDIPSLICHDTCDNESNYNGCMDMCDSIDFEEGGELEADVAHSLSVDEFGDVYECYDTCYTNYYDNICHTNCETDLSPEMDICYSDCDETADSAFMANCFVDINETYIWDGLPVYDIGYFFRTNYPAATENYLNKCTDFIHDGVWTDTANFIGCTDFFGFDFWEEGTTCSDPSLISVANVCETIGWHWNCGELEIGCSRG